MARRLPRPTLRLRLGLWYGVVALISVILGNLLPWQWIPVVAMVGLILGYVVAGRALRPLHDVTATARRLSAETFDERIRHEGPDDEIHELADTFDDMLDRIAAAFEAQKRFVANASHELRTPLAVMRTEVDVTLSDPEADLDEYRRMAEVVRGAVGRAGDLIESLLLLARTEIEIARRLTTRVPTDLGECASGAIESAQVLADELGLAMATSMMPAPVIGDPSLLERLAGNLIENAIRHNLPGGRLWVLAGAHSAAAWMVVGNTGADVDADDVPRLFEPFTRGGVERVGARGAGLGLSIVRAVVAAHGGTVAAHALPDGGGLEFRVELPLAPEAEAEIEG
ncbi:hypothetical protein Afil01_49200 [Actinorhabdospora filicis]|uniref:histidine kinase n=1 Tax=Actinorhabdospora filicis TaxID=1785913 RepID=A0A9W6SQ76_9ACTN|nr:HAMP domain-containing sensor histidine kinase [Actinorhabdospora filicis]GLZ80113.1 hypothetical protein Afil01_49200 [Actinorhabdospora filicis]